MQNTYFGSKIKKGYSLCKILTLGQKLKFQKTCQQHVGHQTKAMAFAKSSLWVKNEN